MNGESSPSPVAAGPPQPVTLARGDRRSLMEAALALLTGGVLLGVTFRALAPFVSALLWALTMTVAAWPVADRLEQRLGGRRRLAAALIGLGYFVVLALPLIYLSLTLRLVFRDAWMMAANITTNGLPEPPAFLNDIPVIGKRIVRTWQQDMRNLPALASQSESVLLDAAQVVFRQLTDLLSAIGEIVFGIILATQTLGMGTPVLRTRRRFATAVGGGAGQGALAATRRAILSVALWLIACGLIEAALSGLGFMLAGVPLASVLAFVCFVCRVLQIGPWPVWIPAVLWLWLWHGSLWNALFLAGWLVLVVMGANRALRPVLDMQRPEVPAPLLSLAVLGGLLTWGFSGMFLGAAGIAVVWSLMANWLRSGEDGTA